MWSSSGQTDVREREVTEMTGASASTGEDELTYAVDDGIGVVTFNRPKARNALTFGMYERLAEICAGAPTDGSLKALIITGAGKAFAAGTDISLFRDFSGADDGLAYEAKMESVIAKVETCPLPTIAAISGACTGGGAAIAAVCDVRIADLGIKFGFPIARTLGNCLSTANLARLNSLLGVARVKHLIFTSRLLDAEQCLAAGLVSELHEDRTALMERARVLAGEIGSYAPLTLRVTKEMLLRLDTQGGDATRVDDADLIALCYASADFREGLEAFLAKRKPNWQGR
jgi:enoyl-CoA hydratase/carnithine racemase